MDRREIWHITLGCLLRERPFCFYGEVSTMTHLEIKSTGDITHEMKGAAAVLNESIERGDLLGESDWFHPH